ncbi:hypothetical protein MLD38_016494 [Melastoma candidum]|uniref:Uncharacterized protein n=1 Tax=Melastoma candidum TaxID=119954 RepID=A0ACB9QPF0_9MYRT|nr:hypothetical protein MLD38_016494 [Melastoma candidum]
MENEEGTGPGILKKQQLALAVRSIQWCYGIFWSVSTRQPGVLEWGDGYYNGDIKTRKMVQSMDSIMDQLGLQRSEQLRELYESLLTGEPNPQVKRPSAALSPEDLTDTEWYYLVCMSFVFDIGQGLPGRTLASNRTMWICNAPFADSKIFTRSLLAKSASIQTVVCFPFLGGVIELGATEQVPEDLSLIHYVKTSFLEIPNPKASKRFVNNVTHMSSKDLGNYAGSRDFEEPQSVPVVRDLPEISLWSSSCRFKPTYIPESSFLVEGANTIASPVRSWQHIDNHFGNCINASDSISEALVDPSLVLEDDKSLSFSKLAVADDQCSDHYQNILAAVLKTSGPLIPRQPFQNGGRVSSFSHWKKELSCSKRIHGGNTQKLLKKILSKVPQMHNKGTTSSEGSVHKKSALKPETDDIVVNHTLLVRRRRKKINQRLAILKSMIPLADKVDGVSLLDETIEYLQELESRVDELESGLRAGEGEIRAKRKSPDATERTTNICCRSKKLQPHERKVHSADDLDTTDFTVIIKERNVLIEMGSEEGGVTARNNIRSEQSSTGDSFGPVIHSTWHPFL